MTPLSPPDGGFVIGGTRGGAATIGRKSRKAKTTARTVFKQRGTHCLIALIARIEYNAGNAIHCNCQSGRKVKQPFSMTICSLTGQNKTI